MNVFLSVYCSVHVLDFDVEELDEYQVQSLPDHDKHACQPSGIKQLLIVPSKGKKSANNPSLVTSKYDQSTFRIFGKSIALN